VSRLIRMFILTLVASAGLLFFAGISPASAHARLISSSPANGQSLTQGPTEIVLTFDQPVTVETLRATLDDGTEVQLGTPVISGNTVTTPWPGGQKPGLYRLGYVVNSQDGHAVEGLMLFTYATASPGTPPAPPSTDSSSPWIPAAIGIAALAVLGGAAALWLRSRGSTPVGDAGSGRHAAPVAMPTVDSTVGSPAQHEPTA
jgi:methionine-rich copper-binding protein CopC